MVKIHPSTVLENYTIGDGTQIGANCSIGTIPFVLDGQWTQKKDGEVFIGENCLILHNVVIVKGTTRETRIGNNVKIDSCCHIAHDCWIGDGTIITAGVTFAGHVTVGKNCRFEPHSTICRRVNICDGVTIGAGSLVLRDITTPGLYFGSPAIFIREKV